MRYWLLHKLTRNRRVRIIRIDGQPYMYRYFVGRLGRFTFYLHRFVRPDAERWVHNHPWRHCLAIVLCGGYWEERLDGMHPPGLILNQRYVGGWRRLNHIGPMDFHRITEPKAGTWTLFIHVRRTRGWGFLEALTENGVPTDAILYHQPLETSSVRGWTTTAPRAKEVPGA